MPEFTNTLLFILVSKPKVWIILLLFRGLHLREECIRIDNIYALRKYTPEFTYTLLFIVVSIRTRDHF